MTFCLSTRFSTKARFKSKTLSWLWFAVSSHAFEEIPAAGKPVVHTFDLVFVKRCSGSRKSKMQLDSLSLYCG